MVSAARAKGLRTQRKGLEYYEAQGYKIDKVELGGKYAESKDLFGLFDAVGVRGSCVLFVQFTTNQPHTHGPYQDFARLHGYSNILVEQLVWYDRKGWVLYKYHKNGTMDREDMRK